MPQHIPEPHVDPSHVGGDAMVPSPSPPEEELVEAPARSTAVALGVIAVAQLLVVLDATVVNIALPLAATDLDMSPTSSQWVVTGYTLAFGALLLLGGRIADVVGPHRVFLAGMAGFALASAVGGLAVNSEMLLAARLGQGVFAAALAPSGLALLSISFTGAGRSRAFAVYGAVAAVGSAFGLLIGGVLTEYLSWRWCFLVNLPVAAVALAVGRWALPVVASRRQSLDLPSALLATAGLGTLVYGFTRAAEEAWTDAGTIVLFALAALGVAGFVLRQGRAASPLLPMRILRHRDRVGAVVAMSLIPAALFAIFFYLSFYFQQVRGYSPVETGLAFLPISFGIILAAGVAGNLVKVVRPRWMVTIGLVMSGVGVGLFGRLTVDTSFVELTGYQLLIAAGAGLVFVTATNLALIGVDEADAGVASAVVNTGQQVGGAMGLSIVSTVVISSLDGASAEPSQALVNLTSAYTDGFLIAAAFPLVAAVITALSIRASAAALEGESSHPVHLG